MPRIKNPLRVLGTGSPAWRIRRRWVQIVLTWCLLELTYLTVFGKPDGLREAIAYAVSGILASTLGSYIFGAVWDDNNIRSTEVDAQAVYQGVSPVTQQNVGQSVQVNPAQGDVNPMGRD